MKLWEILNQAKAAAERISLEESWRKLGPEINAASEEIRAVLEQDLDAPTSMNIWAKVVANLRVQNRHKQ